MNASHLRITAGCLVLCWAATAAVGNPGAAVVMPILFMASFGNGLISLVEIVVAKTMGARWRSLLLIPMGNYFSMWFGFISAAILFDWIWSFWEDPLVGAVPATWIATGVLVAAGFVLEFPFFLLSFDLKPTADGHPARWRRALVTTIIAGAASNVVVAAGIHLSWDHSLLTTFSYPSNPSLMADAAKLDGRRPWVYAITNEGRSIERFRLDGSDREVMFEFDPPLTTEHRIQARAGEAGFDLLVTVAFGGSLPAIGSIDPQPASLTEFDSGGDFPNCRWIRLRDGIGRVATIGFPDVMNPNQTWRAADLSTDDDLGYGITGHGIDIWITDTDQTSSRLVLQNGFIKNAAAISHARLLPGDIVVMAIGRFEAGEPSLGIYAASLRTHQLVRISKAGRSPVVVYD